MMPNRSDDAFGGYWEPRNISRCSKQYRAFLASQGQKQKKKIETDDECRVLRRANTMVYLPEQGITSRFTKTRIQRRSRLLKSRHGKNIRNSTDGNFSPENSTQNVKFPKLHQTSANSKLSLFAKNTVLQHNIIRNVKLAQLLQQSST